MCDDTDLCYYFKNALVTSIGDFEQQPTQTKSFLNRKLDGRSRSIFAVTPSVLTFPYNDHRNHSKKLTFWNRTINTLKIRIKSPDPDVFTICLEEKTSDKGNITGSMNQIVLYGLAARTISIKCTPCRYKIARVPLQLFAYTSRDEYEELQVPLEIYPSTAWFNLPKTIVIPEVVVGRKAHALIILPQPRISERFFVTFQPTQTQNAITLSPMYGTIGGETGIKQLRVTYAPTEFTTVACTINVHFPGLSATTPHEILILSRCRPGKEADLVRKEIIEIESFRPKPNKLVIKYPKLRFKTVEQPQSTVDTSKSKAITANTSSLKDRSKKPPLSLFTLAGVMRFLLRKNDASKNEYMDEVEEYIKRKTAVEILTSHVDLTDLEKLHIYNDIKSRLGLDFVTEGQGLKMSSNQRRDWEEFQNAVGKPLLGKIQDLPPPPPPEEPRKMKHFGGGSYKSGSSQSGKPRSFHFPVPHLKHTGTRKSVSDDENKMQKNIMANVQLDLNPIQKFVQLVLLVITRQRADKRLSKLKVLVETMRKGSRRRSTRGSSFKSSTGRRSIASSSKRKSQKSRNSQTEKRESLKSTPEELPTVEEQVKSKRSSGASAATSKKSKEKSVKSKSGTNNSME